MEEITEYNKLYRGLLHQINQDIFTIQIVSRENTKINSVDVDFYCSVPKTLREQTTHTWLAYEDKRKRHVKTVAKYLPHSYQ